MFNGFIFFHVPFASGTYRAIISAEFFFVVSVAQRVELWIVAPAAGGSNPLAHPNSHPAIKANPTVDPCESV
jgi:hypothetical protein